MRGLAALSLATLLLSVAHATRGRGQDLGPEPAYVVRGHRAELQQQALKDRLDRFHARLSDQLRRDVPDLLATLEPPPGIAYGYQILPRVVPDTSPGLPPKPQVASYSWPWSETLVSREMTNLDGLEAELAKASQNQTQGSRAGYEAIVGGYKKAVDRRRLIDADIDYNWLWQRQIARDRALFDRLTARLNASVDKQSRSASPESETPIIGLDPPPFVSVDPPGGQLRIVTVPFYTDILDTAVVESFRRGVETHWRVKDGENEYRVRLMITTIGPERLYCRHADDGKEEATACAPPAKGGHINLVAHVARFPADGAILTTGAESVQLVAGRAIVLGPHDVAPRTLAHEFGHVLGFPDAYLRGYKDLGPDGFQVMELVSDFADIMSSPGAGSVLPKHFKALITAKQVQALMQSGLDELYKQANPNEAAVRFRQVLALNPDHYGATLQLAKALDRAARPEEALPLWRKMLEMAEAAGDAETLRTVRMRLSEAPQ